jgi:hypothetical protein
MVTQIRSFLNKPVETAVAWKLFKRAFKDSTRRMNVICAGRMRSNKMWASRMVLLSRTDGERFLEIQRNKQPA